MKQTVQIEVHCCDACSAQQDYVSTCINCGAEHCFECRAKEGKKYSKGVYVSGSGDGYYCNKCDAELTKSGADERHAAYRSVASLRHEAKAWSADFERRMKVAEARVQQANEQAARTVLCRAL